MSTAPHKLTIRAYPVGFGDCLLLTWHYGKNGEGDKNILIDFGSTARPTGAPASRMKDVAKHIAATAKPRLDCVVATHRHADHINGFATNAGGTATGNIIRQLKPDLVIQPWTEDPRAATNAKTSTPRAKGVQGFMALLEDMHAIAGRAEREAGRLALRAPAAAQALKFYGRNNLKNLSAVENLMTMGRQKAVYAHFGTELPKSLLPGVTIHVLGPPNLEQSNAIRTMRSRDADEFWELQAHAARFKVAAEDVLFPDKATSDPPIEARWFCRKMSETRADQLMQVVRALDAQMNNTSLILLFEVKGRKILFPGDAQIENWNYVLHECPPKLKKKYEKLLGGVDVYKVGHHGSLNATPKTLWNAFKKKGDATKANRLRTILSTRADKHGSKDSKTEVPRTTLVRELKRESELTSTQTAQGVEPRIIEMIFK